MLPPEALKEFKELYKKEFGDDISDEKAVELAINLLTVMDKVYRPIKKEWLVELEKKEQDEKKIDEAAERLAGIFVEQIETEKLHSKKKPPRFTK